MSIDTIRVKEFDNLLISKISKQPSSQISILPGKLNVKISNWKEIYSLPRKMTPMQDYFNTKLWITSYTLIKTSIYLKLRAYPSALCAVQLVKQLFINCLENVYCRKQSNSGT